MSTEPRGSTAVIVFDGVCLLCNGWVRFLLRHDHEARFRFAAMQSEAGAALLTAHGLDADDPASFLLLDECGAWRDSDALIRVLSSLGAPWRIGALALRLVPARLRDAGYHCIARNRYAWFGRRESCMVPDATTAWRFIGQPP